jgi:hypothetical protein
MDTTVEHGAFMGEKHRFLASKFSTSKDIFAFEIAQQAMGIIDTPYLTNHKLLVSLKVRILKELQSQRLTT